MELFLNYSGYFPDVEIYQDAVRELNSNIVNIYLFTGICLLIYCVINIRGLRNKIILQEDNFKFTLGDMDSFMLVLAIFCIVMGVIYYI